MDAADRAEMIAKHQAAIDSFVTPHLDAIKKLKAECPHYFKQLTDKQLADKWMSEGAYCTVCKKDFGWRCKVSPDGVCHYHTTVYSKVILIDGRVVDPPADHDAKYETEDSCIFCGMPEERK